jgi:hypothetical protein
LCFSQKQSNKIITYIYFNATATLFTPVNLRLKWPWQLDVTFHRLIVLLNCLNWCWCCYIRTLFVLASVWKSLFRSLCASRTSATGQYYGSSAVMLLMLSLLQWEYSETWSNRDVKLLPLYVLWILDSVLVSRISWAFIFPADFTWILWFTSIVCYFVGPLLQKSFVFATTYPSFPKTNLFPKKTKFERIIFYHCKVTVKTKSLPARWGAAIQAVRAFAALLSSILSTSKIITRYNVSSWRCMEKRLNVMGKRIKIKFRASQNYYIWGRGRIT